MFLSKNLQKRKVHKSYLLVSGLLVLLGVLLGLFDGRRFNYLSLRYFTYLSNILVVVGLGVLFTLYDKLSTSRSYIVSTILLAISVTGLVYNLVLVPFANNDIFFSSYTNFSNHLLSMILVLVNYFLFEEKGQFKRKHILVGMVFPLVYWIIFITSGLISNWYPYFFMDVSELGVLMTLVWLVILLLIFAGLGFLLVLFDKSRAQKI